MIGDQHPWRRVQDAWSDVLHVAAISYRRAAYLTRLLHGVHQAAPPGDVLRCGREDLVDGGHMVGVDEPHTVVAQPIGFAGDDIALHLSDFGKAARIIDADSLEKFLTANTLEWYCARQLLNQNYGWALTLMSPCSLGPAREGLSSQSVKRCTHPRENAPLQDHSSPRGRSRYIPRTKMRRLFHLRNEARSLLPDGQTTICWRPQESSANSFYMATGHPISSVALDIS